MRKYIVFENKQFNSLRQCSAGSAIPNSFVGVIANSSESFQFERAVRRLKNTINKLNTKKFGIVFEPILNHSEVARLFRGHGKVLSAGFYEINDDRDSYFCTGYSKTLEVGSDAGDTELFKGYVFEIN